ncbi:MAG: hypothetical protein WD690_07370 [Vicinamibacterales bacterium]
MTPAFDRLRRHGAAGSVLDELAAYCAHPYAARSEPPVFPLPDEPHLERWRLYADDARREGPFPSLRRRFVQLRVPIAAGISADDAYRAATRTGRADEADRKFATGLALADPAGLQFELSATLAGTVPVITASTRADFERLVQAFTERNEPAKVPASMGACIVTGFNNWDRIAAHREAWARSQPGGGSDEAWKEEFARLVPQKALYQDRFIILSRGPYSHTAAQHAGLDDDDWRARSLVIRREHELTHYFTYRVFGLLRSHAADELLADFVGLVRAFGTYRGDLARRFLGLEAFPAFRAGGRLEGYRGTPALSDGAFDILMRMAHAAVINLEAMAVAEAGRFADLGEFAHLIYRLAMFPLDELAEDGLAARVRATL